jgi:hypothetical protein
VKFSFDRYEGGFATTLKEYTERVESMGLARGQPQSIAGPIAH